MQQQKPAYVPSKHQHSIKNTIIAGGSAGITEICIMYPLDVAKTRAQLHSAKGNLGMFGILQNMIKTEGPLKMYRGIAPLVLMETPKRAIKFSSNEAYKKLLAGEGKVNQLHSIMAGSMAGATEAVVVVPFELVKIRLQAKENQGLYKNTADAVVKILKNEGPLALYNGFESTLWRNAVWNAGYFGLIFGIRSNLPAPTSKGEEFRNNFIAGLCSGTFGTMLNTPFDVVKTRIQNQDKNSPVRKYNWVLPGIKTVYQEEGFKALYKGFAPKVLRLGPGGGILLVVVDFVNNLLAKYDHPHDKH